MNNYKIKQIGQALIDISKWEDCQNKEDGIARMKYELGHIGDEE